VWAEYKQTRLRLVPCALGCRRDGAYSGAVTYEDAPSCERHESKVPMTLRTMHSDSSRPDTVLGLYECPECGSERRLPIETDTAAA
jgi:hypothetical protein